MGLDHLLAFSIFAMTTSITPGPNNTMVLASGLNYGFRRSLPHLFGICIGFAIMVIGVGAGLHAVFVKFPALQTILKLVGAVYLLWLAWKMANAGTPTGEEASSSTPLTFIQAAIFQWVNPKAWVIALGALTAFLPLEHSLMDVVLLAMLFGSISFPCCCVWNLFGLALRKVLSSPRAVKVFNWLMALLLVISLYPVLKFI